MSIRILNNFHWSKSLISAVIKTHLRISFLAIESPQIANAVRFRLKWRKQMLTRSFSLKKAKTSKNAVFATGRDGGTRTHGLTVPNRARYQLRYISKFFTLRIVQPFYDLCQLYFYLFQYLFLLNKEHSENFHPHYRED